MKSDDAVRFTLPNGSRWVAKAGSPLSDMLAQTMTSIMHEEEGETQTKNVVATKR